MFAVVVTDGEVHWSERPDPTVGSSDLLVEVAAAGLNGADLMQRAGRYPPPPGIPADIPGLECAGTVVAIGEAVSSFSVGDRVMGLLGGAGQAELATLHERVALRVPDNVSDEMAGGFCETFSTAYDALFSQAGLAAGERLLVNGAAGGVGVAAVQLGVTAGAEVVASVRDPSRRDAVTAFGARAIGPDEVGDEAPFDVVLELVGGPNLAADLSGLALGGRIVVIGVGAGARAEIDLLGLMGKRASLMASTLRSRPLEEKALVARRVERHVLPLFARGSITVPIEEVFSFGEVSAAYGRFAAGGKLGKVVLVR